MGLFSEKTKFDQLKAEKYADIIRAKRRRIIIRLLVVVCIVIGAYIAMSFFFQHFFYPRTTINGYNCSWQNLSASTKRLEQVTDDYTLTLVEKDDKTEEIRGDQIDLHVDPEGELSVLLSEQTGFDWIVHLFRPTDYNFEYTFLYDENALQSAMMNLSCLDAEVVTYPEEPKLSDYVEGVGYEISNPVYGNVVDESILSENLNQSVAGMADTLDLSEADCYVVSDFSEKTEELQDIQEKLNNVVNTTITYEFGDDQVVLDGNQLSEWLVFGEAGSDEDGEDASEEDSSGEEGEESSEDGGSGNVPWAGMSEQEFIEYVNGNDIDTSLLSVSVDQGKLEEFVADIADTYDTKYKGRTLVNHAGETVEVQGGNYGWYIDQASTLYDLIGYLEAGEDYTGEVVFFQRAAQFGEQDYGDTYIEVSIPLQHFWYYRDGELTLESDLVSGNTSTGHGTPLGIYQIAYKARNQTLVGENYSTPVSYWMPFYSGVGLHDASWRSSFGGEIYKYDGSHGCLNLPSYVAEELYGYIEGGEAVLIY